MLRRLQEDIIRARSRKSHDDAYKTLDDGFNKVSNQSTNGTSNRYSHIIDEQLLLGPESKPLHEHPLPLNYIVKLEETFTDQDSVNLIFEYLQG